MLVKGAPLRQQWNFAVRQKIHSKTTFHGFESDGIGFWAPIRIHCTLRVSNITIKIMMDPVNRFRYSHVYRTGTWCLVAASRIFHSTRRQRTSNCYQTGACTMDLSLRYGLALSSIRLIKPVSFHGFDICAWRCIYLSEQRVIIGSGNGLAPIRHQTITWTRADI